MPLKLTDEDIAILFRNWEIEEDLDRIERVLRTGIFMNTNNQNPLRQAAFTEVIVCLNDLLQKANALGVPVSFTDDVPKELKGKGKAQANVTDLVNMARNTVCHIPSKDSYLETGVKVSFNVVYGKCNVIANPDLATAYEDDMCFIFGRLLLYFDRHIVRALREAKSNLAPFLEFDWSKYVANVQSQQPE